MSPSYRGYANPGDEPAVEGDKLAAKVMRTMQNELRFDLTDIAVSAVGSLVIISGNIAREEDLDRLHDTVRAVIGVRGVVSQVLLRPKDPPRYN